MVSSGYSKLAPRRCVLEERTSSRVKFTDEAGGHPRDDVAHPVSGRAPREPAGGRDRRCSP